jgi:hypothetical protein
MTEAEMKRSLDQVSREALSRLENLSGTAGSALQQLRGKTGSAGDSIDALQNRVETVFANATNSDSKMLAKLNRAKVEEAWTKTAFEARRRWLLFLIAYYQYRWKVLRLAAIAGTLFLIYDNWDTIVFWVGSVGQAIQDLIEGLQQQAPSSQKPAPTSGGVGP